MSGHLFAGCVGELSQGNMTAEPMKSFTTATLNGSVEVRSIVGTSGVVVGATIASQTSAATIGVKLAEAASNRLQMAMPQEIRLMLKRYQRCKYQI